jgi:murein L,D-transpeptidase YcbB/YkuD
MAAALMFGAAAVAVPAPAAAQARPAAVTLAGQTVADFYKARKNAPLWFGPRAGDAAQQLVALLSTASIDGLNPDKYRAAALQAAVENARVGDSSDVLRADEQLSEAFAAYVRDLHQDPGIGFTYVDPVLRPKPPSALAALIQAANAPSLSDYVSNLRWMHPFYGELRQAVTQHKYSSDEQRALIEINLQRARALPSFRDRYILVNAAQQRLYMYENGKPVDSMRVVVGKPKYPTPMMSALVRFASLNPYWFVPPDLAADRIAPNVVKRGLKYLDELGYQVLDEWSENPTIIDPSTVDWKAVAEGKVEVRMRQLPGPHNAMGRMKFMFPNEEGIYLHDNPDRGLFEQASRLYSGGCVRLEDAARLGRWMFGRDLVWETVGTEHKMPLAAPIPVHITYLTAMPDGSSITFLDDVYGRDKAQLAASGVSASSSGASR